MFINAFKIVILLLFNVCIFNCYAEPKHFTALQLEEMLQHRLYLFIGARNFSEGNYLVSNYFFSKIIRKAGVRTEFCDKARIYIGLSYLIRGKIKKANKISKNIYSTKYLLCPKDLNAARIFKAMVLHYSTSNFLLRINRYKADTTSLRRAFNSLSKINIKVVSKKYLPLLDLFKYKFDVEIKKNKLYIAEYYFKRGAYLSVIKRLHHYIHNCKDKYDFYNNYLLIRSYNELYLSRISEKLLSFIPSKSKYFKQKFKRAKSK